MPLRLRTFYHDGYCRMLFENQGKELQLEAYEFSLPQSILGLVFAM